MSEESYSEFLGLYSLKKLWMPLVAGIFIDFVCLSLSNASGWGIGGLLTGLIVGIFTGRLMRGIWLTSISLFVGHSAWFINWDLNHPNRESDPMSPGLGGVFIIVFTYSLASAIVGILASVLPQILAHETIPSARDTSVPFKHINTELFGEILQIYSKKYPHNPTGVLRYHIDKRMKEGKTGEQAIEEIIKESR